MNVAIGTLLERIIPCIWITPIDCFWEGAKPLGPHPPLILGEEVSAFISSIPKGNITWKNLNPSAVINEVATLLDLGTIKNFFQRAGIGAAYLDRPCIDPLDHECPKTAPNYFDRCAALNKFDEWNNNMDGGEGVKIEEEIFTTADAKTQVNLFGDILGRKKRAADTSTTPGVVVPSTPAVPVVTPVKAPKGKAEDEEYYNYEDPKDYPRPKPIAQDPKVARCIKYGKGFLRWMNENPQKWKAFLTPVS